MSKFMDDIKKQSEEYGGGSGDIFDLKKEGKGIFKVRLLNEPVVLATHFFGKGVPAVICVGKDKGCKYHSDGQDKPSIKLVTYVIDRRDGKIKLAELPLSISYAINDLQSDEDYAFETFPMPYDVKITHDPDNDDPKAKYRLVASPNRVELTPEEETDFAAKLGEKTPEQYVLGRKQKQMKKDNLAVEPEQDEPSIESYEADV